MANNGESPACLDGEITGSIQSRLDQRSQIAGIAASGSTRRGVPHWQTRKQRAKTRSHVTGLGPASGRVNATSAQCVSRLLSGGTCSAVYVFKFSRPIAGGACDPAKPADRRAQAVSSRLLLTLLLPGGVVNIESLTESHNLEQSGTLSFFSAS